MSNAVLIVDDDVDVRASLAWLLRDEGYTVYEDPDGQPALERLRAHPEGLVVLLDLDMPGMDGFALLRALDDPPPLPTPHAYLVISAFARTLSPTQREQLKHLRIPVIAKPFDLDELLASVATAAARLAAAP